jgi:hypothetical protein
VYTPTSAVLYHAARRGWCDRPIIGRPKQPKGRVRWLEPAEAEKLTAACANHLQLLVIFLLYTGARVGEALYLDWVNVDLEARHVQFLQTKNGEARGIPLHARVVAAPTWSSSPWLTAFGPRTTTLSPGSAAVCAQASAAFRVEVRKDGSADSCALTSQPPSTFDWMIPAHRTLPCGRS